MPSAQTAAELPSDKGRTQLQVPPVHGPRHFRHPIRPDELNGLWGGQGDGTFVNPIVPADFSDIDAIQVGPDYVVRAQKIAASA